MERTRQGAAPCDLLRRHQLRFAAFAAPVAGPAGASAAGAAAGTPLAPRRNTCSMPPVGMLWKSLLKARPAAPSAPYGSDGSRPAVTGSPIQPPMPEYTATYWSEPIL